VTAVKDRPPRVILLAGGGWLEFGPACTDEYLGEIAADVSGTVMPEGVRMTELPRPPEGATLAAALVRALADVTVIEATRRANIPGKEGRAGYSYDFANIGDVVQATRPVLAREGLVALTPVTTRPDGSLQVVVTLLHSSGERMDFDPLIFAGARDPQATGSAITYYRRYALMSALGIAIGEEDDGGEAAASAAQPQQRQASQPRKAAGATKKAAPRQDPPKPTLAELVAPVVAEHGPEHGAAVTRILEQLGDPALDPATRKALKEGFVKELGCTPLALKPEQVPWADAWLEGVLAPADPPPPVAGDLGASEDPLAPEGGGVEMAHDPEGGAAPAAP
jgi:hypothetical protein